MHGKALIQKAPMVNRNKNNGRALEDNSGGVLCLEGRNGRSCGALLVRLCVLHKRRSSFEM